MREYRSEVLGEKLMLLNDNERYDGPLGSYTKSETAIIMGMNDDDIRKVHEVKKMFDGKIIDRTPR